MGKRKKILFVGEHPYGFSGNSHMLFGVLKALDFEKYNPICFIKTIDDVLDNETIFNRMNVPIINANADRRDPWNPNRLLTFATEINMDAIIFVGIDIWVYASILGKLRSVCQNRQIKTAAIFPYDLQYIRKDWVNWIKCFDFPCVYSEYGFRMLKDHVPGIRYFRPHHYMGDFFHPYSEKERLSIRHRHFPLIRDDQFILGFIGNNQFRKCPNLHVEAFFAAKKEYPNMTLHCHTTLTGDYNLLALVNDIGFNPGDFSAAKQTGHFTAKGMRDVINCFDALILCSMQEGLSWVPLEAMLCGVPVIASDSTAHPELIGDAGILVPCEDPAQLLLSTKYGISYLPAMQCRMDHMKDAILQMATNEEFRIQCREKGIERARTWLHGVSDINNLLEEVTKKDQTAKTIKRHEAVLFAQYSSAGDVLMTTPCFKGIKEKHPGLPLVYMTQKKYQDIVTGNPYVDEIIDWDPEKLRAYEVVYNPHGERILPGGFNSLDMKLADMYPYFCKVKADEMLIKEIEPDWKILGSIVGGGQRIRSETYITALEQFIIIHNSGGHPYRIYKHMDIALKGIELPIVQIGGSGDHACQKATIDLRGKLTWRETAWMMKRAKAAICVDSFPMHLAGALGTPVVALFGPAPARVTGALGDPERIINLEPNKLKVCPSLTNCHGEIECKSPCINTISPMQVKKALLSLFNKQSLYEKEEAA